MPVERKTTLFHQPQSKWLHTRPTPRTRRNDGVLSKLNFSHPSCVGPHALVDVEEASQLRPHVLELASLVPASGLDGVTVYGVTHPQHLRSRTHQGQTKYGHRQQV